MRLVRNTSRFKKSLRKLSRSGNFDQKLRETLAKIINTLTRGEKLEPVYEDHELTGKFIGHRECHVKPDLLLIYYIENNDLVLVLVNLGSHSDLFE